MILFEDDLSRPLPIGQRSRHGMAPVKAPPSQGKFLRLSSLKCHSLILEPILGESANVIKLLAFRSGPDCSKLSSDKQQFALGPEVKNFVVT